MSMYFTAEDWAAANAKWEAEQIAANNNLSDYEDSDYYDDLGNSVPWGLYDAGGHIFPDRLADFIDYKKQKDFE